jgi:DNA-binding LacI/PurR family transcriptional regulator/DNA-binding transcriptional regulator YhcF (GntR family)
MSISRSIRPAHASLIKDRSEPKYRAIRESVRESIVNGVYPPGQRLPTEDELGTQFSASRNTVIRALVDLRNEGLLQRVQGAGTFVANPAEQGRQVFAFIAGGEFDTWTKSTVFGRLELALARKLHEHHEGFSLLPDLRREADDPEKHRAEAIERACTQGVAGVFLLPGERLDRADADANARRPLERLQAAGVTTVLLDRDIVPAPHRSEFDLVSLDNLSAGAALGEHLLAQGCRKVVFLMWVHQAEPVKQRLAGLKRVMESAGAQVRVAEANVSDTAAIRAILKPTNYDAVVGKDDHMSAAAMRVLYELGRRVPDEVMLAGFDDSPLAQELAVPLTTYAQPVEAIADAAAHLMLTRLQDSTLPPRQVIVSGKLVVRRSTGR